MLRVPLRSMRLLQVVAPVMLLLGCGGAATAPSGPAPDGAAPAATSAPLVGAPTLARNRLQGRWEITRYTSERRIPDDAMPLMGAMFDSLRLRFAGGRYTAGTSPTTEESTEFAIAGENGDEFTLIAKSGLFDGARCRFTGPDSWEAVDHGPSWPGVSVLRRVADAGGKASSPAPARGSGGRSTR